MPGRRTKSGGTGATRSGRDDVPAAGSTGSRFLADEDALLAVEAQFPEGLTSAQVVEAFTKRSVHLSEATFRKWVQMGLLPRSRRVGRKGKHQGSLGLYPPETIRRIAAIKRRMGENLTIEDIARSLRFREAIEGVERGLRAVLRGFAEAVAAPDSRLGEADRQRAAKALAQLEKQSGELVRRIEELERRVVEPLEREAKARAFGSGTSGGAADLL